MKHLYTITLIIILNFDAQSQSSTAQRDYDPNHMLWLNMQLNGKIKGKFSYGLDLEMRRQADPAHPYDPGTTVGNNRWDIIKHPYQDAIRPWIHYQPNENIRLSWSPVTWFGTWSFPINGKTTYQPEYRTSPQITFFQKLGRVQFTHRYRYEFRFYGVKTQDTNPGDPTGPSSSYSFLETNRQNRFRYLLRAVIPLNNTKLEKGTFYIMASCELFMSMGKNVPSNKVFDQTRSYLVLGYKFHPEVRLEVGYMNQTAFRMNNKAKNNVDLNNNLAVSIIFDNFNSFFKRKNKEE
jgi:hypothetical protein